MQRIQLLQSQLDEWQTCLTVLQSNHLTNYLRFELMELRNKIEILQSYQQQLQFDHEILKYDINTLRKDISSTMRCVPTVNCLYKRRIYKRRKDMKSSYMIKIAFTKDAFTKETYNEMRSNCKLGAIIECNGQLEDEKAQTKVLIVNKIQLISLFNRRHGDDRGFKPYSEPNKRKSKKILCSHFIKYFVTHHKDTKRIPVNTTFIPPICVQSQCIFRHVLLSKKELNCIMEQRELKLRKKNVENNVVIPRHINAWFDWHTLDTNDDIKKVFSTCEVVLGLHPDEATEAIVDLSLKYGKKFAVVPCCVFPNLFPKYLRMDDDDVEKEVVTYLQFVEYLKRKHQCIKIDYLRFKGRNKVLYFDGK